MQTSVRRGSWRRRRCACNTSDSARAAASWYPSPRMSRSAYSEACAPAPPSGSAHKSTQNKESRARSGTPAPSRAISPHVAPRQPALRWRGHSQTDRPQAAAGKRRDSTPGACTCCCCSYYPSRDARACTHVRRRVPLPPPTPPSGTTHAARPLSPGQCFCCKVLRGRQARAVRTCTRASSSSCDTTCGHNAQTPTGHVSQRRDGPRGAIKSTRDSDALSCAISRLESAMNIPNTINYYWERARAGATHPPCSYPAWPSAGRSQHAACPKALARSRCT